MASLPHEIDIAGTWRLASMVGGMTAPMAVPGDAINALHIAGLIPDPYFGRNEYDLRWIAGREWSLTREFEMPQNASAQGWVLEIDGLDTVATVMLNGAVLLKADNAFRRWRVDASLAQGSNSIEIIFHSNLAEAAWRQQAQPFRVPCHAGNSPLPDGNMLRKPQCHFGWDWNIAIAPFGLYPRIVVETVEAGGALEITLTSQRPALFVSLESEQTGRFDDNCFTLLPGIAKLVRFTPAHPMALPAGIAVRDLFTATHRG